MTAVRYNSVKKSHARRSFLTVMLCASMLFTHACPVGLAESTSPAASPKSLEETLDIRGDLTLNNTSLGEALFTISELWNVNFVFNSSVQGEVGGAFKDAPLREILDSILLSNGYSYRPVGESLVVMSMEKLGNVHPMFETTSLKVPGGKVEGIAEAARLLSSPHGKIQPIPSAGSLLVVDYPERIQSIRTLLASLSQGGGASGGVLGSSGDLTDPLEQGSVEVHYFKPKYVDYAAVESAIKPAMSTIGKLGILENENWVVMVDQPANIRLAQQSFQRIDIPRPQVRITAYIYDIGLQDMRKLGVNWNQTTKGRISPDGVPQTLFNIDSLMSIPFDASSTGGVFTFANMSRNFDLNVMVNALDEAKDSRLLADPTVIVMDNEQATFESVEEIPYQQLTQTGEGGNIGTTAFRDAGIKLNVQPRIAPDGTILMKVNPEFSRLAGFTPEDNQPIISRRTAETTLRIQAGQTVVIGGLRVRTDVKDRSGIPFLKDFWLIGPIFRGFEGDIRESELVVFIRPELVKPDEPLRQREAAAALTTECHLDQIPLGEGCPPPPPRKKHSRQCEPGETPTEVIQPSEESLPDPTLLPPQPTDLHSSNPTQNGHWKLRHQGVMNRPVWQDRRPLAAQQSVATGSQASDSQFSRKHPELWRLPSVDEPLVSSRDVVAKAPGSHKVAPRQAGKQQPIYQAAHNASRAAKSSSVNYASPRHAHTSRVFKPPSDNGSNGSAKDKKSTPERAKQWFKKTLRF